MEIAHSYIQLQCNMKKLHKDKNKQRFWVLFVIIQDMQTSKV